MQPAGLCLGVEALPEAVALGRKAGLNFNRMLDVLQLTAVVSPAQKGKFENIKRGEYPATFALRMMSKDYEQPQVQAAEPGEVPLAMAVAQARAEVCGVPAMTAATGPAGSQASNSRRLDRGSQTPAAAKHHKQSPSIFQGPGASGREEGSRRASAARVSAHSKGAKDAAGRHRTAGGRSHLAP